MSKKQVQEGKFLDLTAPGGGVVSGNGYLIDSIFAVAQTTEDAGDKFSGAVEGVHELPKESTADFSEGEKVFWDDTAKEFDVSASGRYEVGVAAEAAASSTTTVKVRLNGISLTAVP